MIRFRPLLAALLLAAAAAPLRADAPSLPSAFGAAEEQARAASRRAAERAGAEPESERLIARLREARSFDPASASDEEVLERLRVDGHAYDKHGPELTDGYLKARLTRLYAATRFSSREAMIRSARRVWTAAEERARSGRKFRQWLGRFLDGRDNAFRFRFRMDGPVGDGFRKAPGGIEPVGGLDEVTVVLKRKGDKAVIETMFLRMP